MNTNTSHMMRNKQFAHAIQEAKIYTAYFCADIEYLHAHFYNPNDILEYVAKMTDCDYVSIAERRLATNLRWETIMSEYFYNLFD